MMATARRVLNNLSLPVTCREELVDHQPSEQRNGEIKRYDQSKKLIYPLHPMTCHNHKTPDFLSGYSSGIATAFRGSINFQVHFITSK